MTVLKKEQSLYAIPEGVDPELLMKVLGNPEMAALRTSLAKTMFTITLSHQLYKLYSILRKIRIKDAINIIIAPGINHLSLPD